MSLLTIYGEFIFEVRSNGLMEILYRKGVLVNGEFIKKEPLISLPSYKCTFLYIYKMIKEERASEVNITGEDIMSINNFYNYMNQQFKDVKIIRTITNKTSTNCDFNNQVNPFIEGFKLLVSGLYSNSMYHDGVKHILLDDNISEYLKYKPYQNINSSIISQRAVCNNLVHKLENIIIKDKYLDSSVKSILSYNLKDKKIVNVYKFNMRKNILNKFFKKNDLFILIFNNSEDLKEYEHFIRRVNENGEIRLIDCLFIYKDECMWSPAEFCSKNNILRISFLNEKKFLMSDICYCESDFEKKDILDNRKVRSARFNKTCTIFKSNHLLELLNNIRDNNPFIKDFIKIRNILKSFAFIQDDFDSKIYFSTPLKSRWNDLQLNIKNLLPQDYILFEYENICYLYNKINKKFYEINKISAKLLEIFLYVNDYEYLKRYIKNEKLSLKEIIFTFEEKLNIKINININKE